MHTMSVFMGTHRAWSKKPELTISLITIIVTLIISEWVCWTQYNPFPAVGSHFVIAKNQNNYNNQLQHLCYCQPLRQCSWPRGWTRSGVDPQAPHDGCPPLLRDGLKAEKTFHYILPNMTMWRIKLLFLWTRILYFSTWCLKSDAVAFNYSCSVLSLIHQSARCRGNKGANMKQN